MEASSIESISEAYNHLLTELGRKSFGLKEKKVSGSDGQTRLSRLLYSYNQRRVIELLSEGDSQVWPVESCNEIIPELSECLLVFNKSILKSILQSRTIPLVVFVFGISISDVVNKFSRHHFTPFVCIHYRIEGRPWLQNLLTEQHISNRNKQFEEKFEKRLTDVERKFEIMGQVLT